MNLISEHFYDTYKKDDAEYIWQTRNSVKRIADAHRKYRKDIPGLAEKDIRIAMDEWNYWLVPYIYGELGCRYYFRDTLGVAAGLHEYFRNSDIIFMANYAQTVNVIGCIKTTKTEAGFATTGLPLMMYRQHFGTIPLEIANDNSLLDVAAALTQNKKVLTIGVVNISSEAQSLKLNLNGMKLKSKGKAWSIGDAEMMAYNNPGEEPNVVIKESKFKFTDTLTVKPASVTIFKLNIK
jgi:alpha-N-arabinofuranosidase